ncbi:helix-turn-helix domain-containing protein [Paraclostridium bifermentans]|nr:helix-turn-helix domain-containing protein [Paraclostridium bifermentans]
MMKEYSNKLDKNVQDIDLQALEYLCEYSWPGNIRELQNVIEYSVNRCEGKIITLDNLPNRIKRANSNEDQIIESNENIKTLDELEKKEIIKALEKYKDYKKDKDLAAKALGISRATLYRKIERYKISLK